tara:strand:+ start:2001 stop:2402 length:402 start_codon:yes stop_codon:yes gene_type:complete
MIKKIVKTNRAPDILVHYCDTAEEAYAAVFLKHGVDMMSDLVVKDDAVYGFSIANEIDDTIEIFFNMSAEEDPGFKTNMIGECIHAAISLARRKLYMTMDENKPITFGEDTDLDDVLIQHIANVINKVMDYEE